MNFIRALVLVLTTSLILGCASPLTSKPEAPTVSVTRVVPLNLSFTESELGVTLRVVNPNPYALPIQKLLFDVILAGEKIAVGNSAASVTIPANGEAQLEVAVTAGLSKLWGQVKNLFDNGDNQDDVKYSVVGTVKLANWPARIPFNVERTLESPLQE